MGKAMELLRKGTGANMIKHTANKKATLYNFTIKESTFEIVYVAPRTNKPFIGMAWHRRPYCTTPFMLIIIIAVDLFEIREIRKGTSATLCKVCILTSHSCVHMFATMPVLTPV